MYMALIATADLAAHLADPDFVIVDVRHDLMQPDAWGESQYRAGHIPGAHFAHIDRDLSAAKTGKNGRHPLPPPAACAGLFGRLGIDAAKQIVAYDQQSGSFASRLWWMLRWLGHDAAAVLDGGFDKWQREGRPVTGVVPVPREATFAMRGAGPTVNADDVLASLPGRTLAIVDARAPERFRGEVEPMDPVAGHIPGALNRPYLQNLNPDQTFKPATVLREEFARLLARAPSERVVHMCGSGVTACHNVLAMAIAGFPPTRIYPGSWSEWCADPLRPVARGEP